MAEHGDPRCGYADTDSGDPCQNPVSGPGETCHLHPDAEESGSEHQRQESDGDAGSDPSKDSEVLPDPPADCPKSGCDSRDYEPIRTDWDGTPQGWRCTGCGRRLAYCMEPLEDGHCHRHVETIEDPCYMHESDGGDLPEGHGAPEENDNAVGNPGGSPPDGNINAMKHGLHMSAERLLEVMDEQQREVFKHRFVEYRDGMLNDSQAMALAAGAVMREELVIDLLDDGFTRTVYTDDGQEYQQFKKDDMQALQGFFRELRLGLHYEGNSAQHQGGDGGAAGHPNLDKLVDE